jgi:hypothetical protein
MVPTSEASASPPVSHDSNIGEAERSHPYRRKKKDSTELIPRRVNLEHTDRCSNWWPELTDPERFQCLDVDLASNRQFIDRLKPSNRLFSFWTDSAIDGTLIVAQLS